MIESSALSRPASNFASICSITSFFLPTHAGYTDGDDLWGQRDYELIDNRVTMYTAGMIRVAHILPDSHIQTTHQDKQTPTHAYTPDKRQDGVPEVLLHQVEDAVRVAHNGEEVNHGLCLCL